MTDRQFQWLGAGLMTLGVMFVCAGLAGGGIVSLLGNGLVTFIAGAIISNTTLTPRHP